MKQHFVSLWINCVDESISIWFGKFTCPGWIWCQRKPHPFGNEYHTTACGQMGIIFYVNLVEGKDHPPEMPKDSNEKYFLKWGRKIPRKFIPYKEFSMLCFK